ncbi:hypothetical protein OAF98_04555 [Planctomicrobium sp.]|nr:hypothetical protein [Planctomicrobium sp.]MDB4731555.1 hypothetical protein [bacterium]MDB4743737.1 hypothetical protein [Planctomicrobium sp.]
MSKKIKRGVKFGEFGTKTQDQTSEPSPGEIEPEHDEPDFDYEYGWVRDALREVENDSIDENDSREEMDEPDVAEIEAETIEEDEFHSNEIEEPLDYSRELKSPEPRPSSHSSDVNRRLKLIQKLKDSISNSQ